MRKERKLSFCLTKNILIDGFRCRNKFGMTFMLLVVPFMFGEMGEASAQCVATQDCASLGYTETSCPNGGIKCPFGSTWSCKTEGCGTSYKYTCTGANQIKPISGACGGKYVSCKCAAGYEWKSGACSKALPKCQIGYIYYTDNTCSYNLDSTKTVKGVVVYAKSGGGGVGMTAPVPSSSSTMPSGVFERYFYPSLSTSEYEAGCISTDVGDLPTKVVASSIVNNALEIASTYKKIFIGMYDTYHSGGYFYTGTADSSSARVVWGFGFYISAHDYSASGPMATDSQSLGLWHCFEF